MMTIKQISALSGIAFIAIAIGLSYYLWYGGACTITDCETEIEVIDYTLPTIVDVREIIKGDFTVKNQGSVTAENCVLRWGYNPNPVEYVNTDSFSLSPNEEIKIHLQSSSGARGYTSASSCWLTSTVDTFSDAWVLCENTDSGRSRNTILLECP